MSEGEILLVEDDAALRRSVKATLGGLQFTVADVTSGEQALLELQRRAYEVVLLDINMSGMGGVEACRRIRERYPKLQIIVLTVRDKQKDKTHAFSAGADDYVTKPFHLTELVARIRAGVRRLRTTGDHRQQTVHVGEIRLDPEERRVFKAGKEIHLTPKEFDLLSLLMQHAGKPISHSKLLSSVWGEGYGNEREYLRTYMSQLRRKIEDDPASPRYLTTDNYIGYRFQLAE